MNDIVYAGGKYDIPMLNIGMQAEHIVSPFFVWGHNSRRRNNPGTFCFYTDDYKFSALWKNPNSLPFTGCRVVVEPNYSTRDEMPEAVIIYKTYQKRWLSRFWQEGGIKVVVDLNVSRKSQEINLLGVPKGWGSYAIRSHRTDNDMIQESYDRALHHSGNNITLFLVYGGGKKIREMCNKMGWLNIPDKINV